jgi:alkylhydroperoxidase/carboxymuconolactone decarboxylase family protein YurZ
MNILDQTMTATSADGTEFQVQMSPMYHFYQAKEALEKLKEKYPNHAERLFGDKDEEYEDDKDYEIEELLDGAYHKLWNIAQLIMLRGVTVMDWRILQRYATAAKLKWNGQDFVCLEA